MRRLRLLCYLGSLHPGGAERQVLTLLQQLDRTRCEPFLMLAQHEGMLLSQVPTDVAVESCQVNTTGPRARWERIRRLIHALRRWQVDLVYSRTYLATLDAALACWWCRIPHIAVAVADPAVQFAMYAKRPQALWWWYSRWSYLSAAKVVTNSEGLQEQMRSYWKLPAARVCHWPNAYNFQELERLANEPLPIDPRSEHFRLLTVGRIDADKQHLVMLAAVENLVRSGRRGVTWWVVGTGPLADTLRCEVEKRQLSSHVVLLGAWANPYPFYRQAHVFVLPSRSEGFPNVLVEALALRVPVISTDCRFGPREILDDGRYGQLVPVGDVQALTQALCQAYDDLTPLRERMLAAQSSLRSRYDAQVVVPLWEQRFLQVLRESRS
ncbi:MAG: glycosyl transferase [Planctomycetaceae bacterium]|nr:MAG: glycosyl transferase [Planctomycetaceae bacterium]